MRNLFEEPKDGEWGENSLGLSINQYDFIEAFCPHCNVDITQENYPHTKTLNTHRLNITKQRVSFRCPCHGGSILSVKKSELPGVVNLN